MPALPVTITPWPPFAGLPSIPAIAELQAFKHWVAWRYEQRNGALTKPPVSPRTGYGASHSDPRTWGSYQEAETRALADHLPGVGIVITEDDGLTGADLDECRDPESGALEPWAADVLALAETYAEISPSQTGIRLIWRGKIDETIKCDPAHVEIYRDKRYLTITGNRLPGSPDAIAPAPLTEAALMARVAAFKAPPAPKANGAAPPAPDFFRAVNDRALASLGAWFPAIFPQAKFQIGVGSYRVSSKSLGRDLQEDLSASPQGIVDFGVADMGDARRGARTAIDIAVTYGGHANAREAAMWLCERIGVRPSDLGWQEADPIAAVSQANLARLAVPAPLEIEPEPDPPKALDTSPLEDFRFEADPYLPESMGGLIGAVARHILDTALFPVPDFACLASLVFASALYGRRWTEPMNGGGLNLYAIATAPTGWGKDHPLQEPRQLAWRCGIAQLLGPDEFKSDSAIEKTLRKGPVRACFMDEIGIVLQANQARNASSWERRVRKALLQVYSASKSMWTGSQAAGDESDKGAEPIHRPILSLYGTSTPEELYKGLTEDNVRDGLFGRLIFASPDKKPRKAKPGEGDYDGLAQAVDAIRSFTPPGIPDASRALYHATGRNALLSPSLIRVAADSDAMGALEIILEWQRDLTEREFDLSSIANRAGENVGKLATLRALSRDHAEPRVEYTDVQWGWSIVERSLFVIARDIEKHMVGSEYEGLVKAIKRHLEDAGKAGLTLTKLNERHGIAKAHGKDKETAYRQLVNSGDIVMDRTGNRGLRAWLGKYRT